MSSYCLQLLISVPLELRDPARGFILLPSSLISGAAAVLPAGVRVRSRRVAIRIVLARIVIGVRLGLRGHIRRHRPPAFGTEAGLIESRAQFSQILPQGLRQLMIGSAHRYVDFRPA